MSKEHVNHENNIHEECLRIQDALDKLYDNLEEQNIEQFIKKIKILEKFSFNKKKCFVIFDHRRYLPLYISDNCINYGYTPEEIYGMSILQTLKHLHWSQVPGIFKLVNLGKLPSMKTFNKSPIQNRESFICGIKITDKYKNRLTFFVREKMLSPQKNGAPLLSLLIIDPISHLVKKNVFWIRFKSNYKGADLKYFFTLNSMKQSTGDLLSDRQIEILHLIIQNKDIETIGQILKISPETVKKHRKNMLARVGAKDMSALVYLCEQCKLI